MGKLKNLFSLFVPTATVFISSFCIMVLELVASRLIARHLGSSLYTWTAVIGVVLAGITIGNYIGGRIADKYPARKALAVLFGISSAACVITVILNNLVGDWIWLWQFSWPVRVFTHVTLVFLIPSLLLGTISPVVAKMALERGLSTGRTIGDIYAWGAAGSIVGTFVAGFYLIAAMGTIAIIWTVAAVLLVMAILYMVRLWPLYIWAVVFLCALFLAVAPLNWCKTAGAAISIRETPNPKVIYENETQYCYVAVKRMSDTVDMRAFMQDKLMHSQIVMGDITDLHYLYEQIYAALTNRFAKNKTTFAALVIGGGGYVYPRYIAEVWPGSSVDVVEIDPGVTEAAMQAFGLDRATKIKTFQMDARNYVDGLLEKKRIGENIPKYDFIYEDALTDYSVPYQLTTKEFNDKLASLLTPDGVYMIEMIDMYSSALFLGSFVNTLEETFPYVYVVSEGNQWRSMRNTFVLVAAMHPLDLTNLIAEYKKKPVDMWVLNKSEIDGLKAKAKYVVLTDDYAPVENLVAPAVRKSGEDFLIDRYMRNAQQFQKQGKFDEAIAEYKKVLEITPDLSIRVYNDIAIILSNEGKWNDAIQSFRKALEYNEHAPSKQNMANIHYSLGVAFKQVGKEQEAAQENALAIKEYKESLTIDPNSLTTLVRLGDALAGEGKFLDAAQYFEQAVNLDPADLNNHLSLIQALEYGGNLDAAIGAVKKSIDFFVQNKQEQAAAQLRQQLELLEFKKSKGSNPN